MTERAAGQYRTSAALPGVGPVIAVTLFQGHLLAVRATEDNPAALFMLAPDETAWKQIHPHKEQQA